MPRLLFSKKKPALKSWLAIPLLVCMSFTMTLKAQPIMIINNSNAAPHSTTAHNGFVDLIATEAFRRAGFELQLVQQPPERGLINANNGQIAGDLSRIAGIETLYPDLVRVPENVLEWEFAVFSKTSRPISNWKTITENPVGHIKGWKIFEKKLAGSTLVSVTENAEQLFRLLALNRVDAVLYERWQGLALIHQLDQPLDEYQFHTLEKRPMFIYLNKRHAGLVINLATELRNLKSEGFYQNVFNKTLAPYLTGDRN